MKPLKSAVVPGVTGSFARRFASSAYRVFSIASACVDPRRVRLVRRRCIRPAQLHGQARQLPLAIRLASARLDADFVDLAGLDEREPPQGSTRPHVGQRGVRHRLLDFLAIPVRTSPQTDRFVGLVLDEQPEVLPIAERGAGRRLRLQDSCSSSPRAPPGCPTRAPMRRRAGPTSRLICSKRTSGPGDGPHGAPEPALAGLSIRKRLRIG